MKSKFIEWSYADQQTSSLLSFYCSQYGASVTMRHEGDETLCRIGLNMSRKDMRGLRDFLNRVLDMDIGFKKGMQLNKGDYEELVKMAEEYNNVEDKQEGD